jgi:hypothetical protein
VGEWAAEGNEIAPATPFARAIGRPSPPEWRCHGVPFIIGTPARGLKRKSPRHDYTVMPRALNGGFPIRKEYSSYCGAKRPGNEKAPGVAPRREQYSVANSLPMSQTQPIVSVHTRFLKSNDKHMKNAAGQHLWTRLCQAGWCKESCQQKSARISRSPSASVDLPHLSRHPAGRMHLLSHIP